MISQVWDKNFIFQPRKVFSQINNRGLVRHYDLIEGEDGLFCFEKGDEMMELEALLEPYDLGTRRYPTD